MKTVIALMFCVAAVTAFDCYRQNNTCAMSHMTCDTAYTPFCEHIFTHERLYFPAVTAFDCYRQNNTCAMSHMTCDTGYTPFCEHIFTHEGPRIGFCTCDKACNAAADCANTGEDGCPPMSHPTCDMMHHVCHCFGRPHHTEGNRT